MSSVYANGFIAFRRKGQRHFIWIIYTTTGHARSETLQINNIRKQIYAKYSLFTGNNNEIRSYLHFLRDSAQPRKLLYSSFESYYVNFSLKWRVFLYRSFSSIHGKEHSWKRNWQLLLPKTNFLSSVYQCSGAFNMS